MSEVLPPAELALSYDARNANRHTVESLSAVQLSVARLGAGRSIVVDAEGAVIGGEATLKAARQLGLKIREVRTNGDELVVVVREDMKPGDPRRLALALADNQTGKLSQFDEDALAEQLKEISGDLDLLTAVGFSDAELMGLLNSEAVDEPDGDAAAGSELTDDDSPESEFLAPFPWFGGKSRVARAVWKRFGDATNYIEPFFGSGACLLHRPLPFAGNETVNDFDGLVANFWRAVKSDPDAVANYADWPVNENDLHARHAWLVARKESLQAKLEGDPDVFDTKIAGWWAWGMACWIGSGFCSGKGPWQVQEVDGARQLVHLGNAGQGVNRQLVHLGGAGRGVNRKLVHLGNAGQDADAKAGRGECGLLAWMQALSERLQRVRVCCGDWKRICGGDSGDSLGHFFSSGSVCAVFLDPPYADTADRDATLYRVDSESVAHEVREWAIAHGDDIRLRIALCGYEGEHKMPPSWDCVAWKAKGGMASVGSGDTHAKDNSHKERVWFSPHCVPPANREVEPCQP